MINIIENPDHTAWKALCRRPAINVIPLQEMIKDIFSQVEQDGDLALKRLTAKFDHVDLDQLLVSDQEFSEADGQISSELRESMNIAQRNIQTFHEAQFQQIEKIETAKGIFCWRESRAIDSVGLYIPGGSAPLFSTVLMLGVPAAIAGCKNIVLCSPPNKDGKIHPAILAACKLVGIRKVYKAGGAQAIAAMSFGTKSIAKVYKLFGPGNQYVTAAKQYAQQLGVAIDMPAGPSEVLVFADHSADPQFIASDLLSQAEHGVDSQVVLVTTSKELVQQTNIALQEQLEQLPRKSLMKKALEHARFLYFDLKQIAWNFVNEYAPEHLILAIENAEEECKNVQNAGSVFLGNYSPESVGDYASGTNHTLPTNGFAKAYSGVSLDSFVKKITFQQLSKKSLQQIGPAVIELATAEQLDAHASAVKIRISDE